MHTRSDAGFASVKQVLYNIEFWILCSGGSRISRRGGVDLVRGAVDPRGGYVSKILHVKTKESGPVGGGARRARPPLDPPMLWAICWIRCTVYIKSEGSNSAYSALTWYDLRYIMRHLFPSRYNLTNKKRMLPELVFGHVFNSNQSTFRSDRNVSNKNQGSEFECKMAIS